MIYVTGDTHGPKAYSVYGVDGVSRRFNRNSFPEQKEMTRDDYVIICGDFGCIWNYDSRYDSSRSSFKDVICLEHGESKEEKYWLDWLEGKSFTTVFCDGNHENYDRLDNAYPEVDFHGGRAHQIRKNVFHLMRGYVFDLDGVSLFVFGGAASHDVRDGILHPADYTDEDKRTLTSIVELFQFSPSNMYRLVSEAKTKTHLTEHVIKNGSYIKWNKTSKQFDVGLVKGGKEMRKTLKSEHVREMLLKASWFEYQVASMLRKWDRSGAIRLNCIFPYHDSAAKNEIDILVETREKLLFVECKTQIEDNTDIDKFASAVRNYGGMGSKALFVTDRKMSGKAIEKCKDNGILTFSLQDEHLEMPSEKALAMLLDSELFNINTK